MLLIRASFCYQMGLDKRTPDSCMCSTKEQPSAPSYSLFGRYKIDFVVCRRSVFILVSVERQVDISFVITCWERAYLLALLCVVFSCVFVTFPYGVVDQVWYLIVSIPDRCILAFFKWLPIRRHVVLSRSPNDNNFVKNPIYLAIEFFDGIFTLVVTRIYIMYNDKT